MAASITNNNQLHCDHPRNILNIHHLNANANANANTNTPMTIKQRAQVCINNKTVKQADRQNI